MTTERAYVKPVVAIVWMLSLVASSWLLALVALRVPWWLTVSLLASLVVSWGTWSIVTVEKTLARIDENEGKKGRS